MTRTYFYPAVAGLCVLSLASACHSNADSAASKAAAPVAEAGVIAAKEYPVLTLMPQDTQVYIDYPTVLQTDQRTGKADAYFSVNEKAVSEYEWNRQSSTVQQALWQMNNVQLLLANGTVYELCGQVGKVRGQVAPASGSVAVKVTFPNPTGELRTGVKGSVRLPLPIPNALLVPKSATYEVQGKRSVYVVGSGNKVASTTIEVLPLTADSSYVVRRGLKAGDHIVTQGVGTLRDGQAIAPLLLSAATPPNPF